MEDVEQQPTTAPMKVRVAFLYWFLCLSIWILILVFSSYIHGLGNAAVVFYFIAGFYLNKAVLPKLIEWHPMYNTIDNVASEKLKLFFAWPITYFILLMKLGINKIL